MSRWQGNYIVVIAAAFIAANAVLFIEHLLCAGTVLIPIRSSNYHPHLKDEETDTQTNYTWDWE